MRNHFERALAALRRFAIWVSPPTRLFAFVLSLAFFVSLGAWAIFDKNTAYILYFPSVGGQSLRGEERYMLRRGGVEARASQIVAEFLLGPASPDLAPAFPTGTGVDGVLYRKGTLFVDLAEDAALLPEDQLRLALKALDSTLKLGLHQVPHIVLTIGGMQPWTDGLRVSSSTLPKKP